MGQQIYPSLCGQLQDLFFNLPAGPRLFLKLDQLFLGSNGLVNQSGHTPAGVQHNSNLDEGPSSPGRRDGWNAPADCPSEAA